MLAPLTQSWVLACHHQEIAAIMTALKGVDPQIFSVRIHPWRWNWPQDLSPRASECSPQV
jgi:hypothetical protein